MTRLLSTLVLTLLVVACFGVASGADHTVGSGGDFATIALALADGGVGRDDTLLLLDGTHVADDAKPYQGMTIRSQSGDKTACLIRNGSVDHNAFSLEDTVGVSFYDLEFRSLGGAFTFYDGCMIHTGKQRVAADTFLATLYMEGCEFNAVQNDTITSCGPAIRASGAARVELVDCIFDSCRTPAVNGTCGAVFIGESKVTRVRRCVFTNNTAASYGGALGIGNAAVAADSAAIVSGCLFVGNSAPTGDAALRIIQINADVEVSYCTFVDNTTDGTATGNISSSVQTNSTLTVDHCVISGGDAYAVNSNGNITSASHMNTWATAEDHVFAAAHTDTMHVPPEYNTLIAATGGYGAGADGVWRCKDDSYMGWWEYVPRKGPRADATQLTTRGARWRSRGGRR